jgi:hypothetical protein
MIMDDQEDIDRILMPTKIRLIEVVPYHKRLPRDISILAWCNAHMDDKSRNHDQLERKDATVSIKTVGTKS